MCGVLRRANAIELAKFATVGALNTLIGLAIIYAAKWWMHLGDVVANLLGYLLCIGLGFVLNGRWTFGKTRLDRRQLAAYFLVVVVAYGMNLLAVMASIDVLNVPGDLAQLVGVPVFTLTSFLMNRNYVFAR